MARIDPVTRRPWPPPVGRVVRVERREPHSERDEQDAPPPGEHPDPAPPDDGHPHVDVRA